MYLYFGTDSRLPANTRLSNGFYMYDWVTRKRSAPVFWGRYISGENALNTAEAEFLASRYCRIALLFDDFTESEAVSDDGTKAGLKAVLAARMLEVPANEKIALFAEIDPAWHVWDKWIKGYAETVYRNGYIPGFTANTDSSKNFSFDRSYGRFFINNKKNNGFESIVWATEPCSDKTDEWKPFAPSVISPEKAVLWRNNAGGITYRSLSINEDLMLKKETINYMWNPHGIGF